MLIAPLALSGCSPKLQAPATAEASPTPEASQPKIDVKLYTNDTYGFSLYVPRSDEVFEPSSTEVSIIAPGEGHDRGLVIIMMEPANGRTAEQVVEAAKTELGPGFNINAKAIAVDDTQALVVTGMPGQDVNRQLFMVHDDLLYHMTFSPDDPQAGPAYQQMEDVFAVIVNTFHFTK